MSSRNEDTGPEVGNAVSITTNAIEIGPKQTSLQLGEDDELSSTLTDRTICDEQITYLGYFSCDEMDMLRFMQHKAANLRTYIEQMVRTAKNHYRRDHL